MIYVLRWAICWVLLSSAGAASSHKLNVDAAGRLARHVAPRELPETLRSQQYAVMRRESPQEKLVMASGQSATANRTPGGHHLELGQSSPLALATLNRSAAPSPAYDVGLRCDTLIFAPEDPCPYECPYMAEDSLYVCHFRCVTPDMCGTLDPVATIADPEMRVCRRCIVAGCDQCHPGMEDRCERCGHAYYPDDKGQCKSLTDRVMFIVKIVIGALLLILLVYYFELATRKATNKNGLKHGLAFRYRTRIHMPPDTPEGEGVRDADDEENLVGRQLYPLSTNLMRLPIAGAGTCLHFNFQSATLAWAVIIAYTYSMCASLVSTDLLILGLTPAKTSAQLCSVVHWGHSTQMSLIWSKTCYVFWAYLFSFVGLICYSICQNREFHRLDDAITQKDYVAVCTGLPRLKGSDLCELQLREFFEEHTEQKVAGVSICWDYRAKLGAVNKAIEDDWLKYEEDAAPPPPPPTEEEEEAAAIAAREPGLGALRRAFRYVDRVFFFQGPPVALGDQGEEEAQRASQEGRRGSLRSAAQGEPAPEEPSRGLLSDMLHAGEDEPPHDSHVEPEGPVDVTTLLNEMESSDVAFVVFETEEGRDAAVEAAKKRGGFIYDEKVLNLTVRNVEPGSCRFVGLTHGTSNKMRYKKLARGAVIVIGALIGWAVCFYLPYAFYMASFSYARGDQPTYFARILFTVLVVAGNQLMYLLADVIATSVEFGFEEDREVCYNVIYFMACIINLVADMVITIYLAYRYMVAMGVHTADNRLLESITSFREIFESYPMQKAFGELLFAYAFPSCFLLPYIMEPAFTIWLPYHLSRKLVGSHDEVQGREAEKAFKYFLPMNLGRYADICLNMVLACGIFFAPGGFTLPTFLTLVASHIYIYGYDHYRVLRCTPSFCYSTEAIEYFGQLLMVVPTAILAACCVFRGAQYVEGLSDLAVLLAMIGAFLGHSILHIVIITFVAPLCKPEPHKPSTVPYDEMAKHTPMTFFSSNPVHCLRSKYLFGHQPPQIHCTYGKEHLQKANPDIGAYFEDPTYGDPHGLGASKDKAKAEAGEDDDAP